MATNYIQEGKALNYTPSGADVSSGDLVVIGTIAGIAKTDIADGKTGAVHISGVFSVAKASGAVSQGAKLYWSSANSNLTTTAPYLPWFCLNHRSCRRSHHRLFRRTFSASPGPAP